MKIEYWFAFAIYFCILFFIAVGFRKRNSTSADFLLGGRKLNFWVTALSAQASDMSSWIFMAFPMSIFLGGVPQISIAISLFVGMLCSWQFVAIPLRLATEKYDSYTLSTYFSKRYHDSSHIIRTLTALLCLFFITYYLSAGLISIGFLFESLFQLDYVVGVLIATVVMVGYTFIGGFVSVAWADLFQALFLLAVIIIVPILAFFEIDGWHVIEKAANNANISLSFFSSTSEHPWQDILLPLFGWGLGYLGMPHIITKFMGIKNAKDLVKSKYVGMSWFTCAIAASATIGIVAIGYFKNGITNPELVFIEMVKELFHPFIAGFALCGILAATISTMDSQILVAASMLTEDIYKSIFQPKLKNIKEIQVFRTSVIMIAFIALSISFGRNKTIMDTVYYAWSGLGNSFGPLILMSLYSNKVTKTGAIAGIITGGALSALWPWINSMLTQAGLIGPVYAMIPIFPLSLAMIWLFSRVPQKIVN